MPPLSISFCIFCCANLLSPFVFKRIELLLALSSLVLLVIATESSSSFAWRYSTLLLLGSCSMTVIKNSVFREHFHVFWNLKKNMNILFIYDLNFFSKQFFFKLFVIKIVIMSILMQV